MDTIQIDFNELPKWWAVCAVEGCQRQAVCLRRRVYELSPATLTKAVAVLPHALDVKGGCPHFVEAKMVRMARGFKESILKIQSRDARMGIRLGLTDFFGSKGTYYRYRDGEKLLNPAQQQYVESLYARYGCADTPIFDVYVDYYDFSLNNRANL